MATTRASGLILLSVGWLAQYLAMNAALAADGQELFRAIRNGDTAGAEKCLAEGVSVNVRDKRGNTPLISAALYADREMLQLLLSRGADINATNKAGATALMRAAPEYEKVKLLTDRGADIKARSALLSSALILAARQQGSANTVRLLLEKGADVNARNKYGATALMAAAAAEDDETVRLLLERGAKVNAKPNMDDDGFLWGGGRTALMWAAFRGRESLLRLLLQQGAAVNEITVMGTALSQAAWAGNATSARVLLEAGAEVDQADLFAGYTPLHWAASSELPNPALTELLLQKGARPDAEGGQSVDGFLGVPQTPLMLARKRGDTPVVHALIKGGAREGSSALDQQSKLVVPSQSDAVDAAAIVAAMQRAVAPLQKTAAESRVHFLRHASKQDCVSCHQQYLPMVAVGLARSRGLAVDVEAARKQIELVSRDAENLEEITLQASFHPEPAQGIGYALLGLRSEQQPPSEPTDAFVHHLLVVQGKDGRWFNNLPRPPIQSSDVAATALAVHALRFYGWPAQKDEFEKRIERARAWLRNVQPETNEERAYQLLGLAWANVAPQQLARLADDLARQQRPDGGWAQLPKLSSDAFATGQSLYALLQAGWRPGKEPAVRRGLAFLLRTQLPDGTWRVRRRTFPFQPPMESGFPHGKDSWVSAAATSWGVMALAMALDPALSMASTSSKAEVTTPLPSSLSASKGERVPAGRVRETASTAIATSASVGFVREIKPLLERSCVSCHSGARPKAGYRVDEREAFLKGGNRGEAAVVPGQSGQSVLLRFVSDQMEDLEMPPLAKRQKYPPLTKEEIERLRTWVDQGADWPKDATVRLPAEP